MVGSMPYRRFGATGLEVSEVGFGAWAIGGNSYGSAKRGESLAALARAEELGCNLVDTAAVYGDSEGVLGEFLADRRSRWIVSTKYSGQEAGMTATLESQLRALRTDHVDFYMIHWVPAAGDKLLAELASLKRAGKTRFVGVSLYSAEEIDRVLANSALDGFMVAVSLLDPDPFLARRVAIAASGKAVIARSSLKEGFLAGKFTHATRFTDPADQRSKWSEQQIARTVDQVERFRFLEARAGSLATAAIAYPLVFPEVSSVVAEQLQRPRQASPLDSLSSRERQILQLVAEGRSSAMIGEALHLSPKTIDTYRSRLMEKLGIGDVAGLVKFAVLHGLTPLK